MFVKLRDSFLSPLCSFPSCTIVMANFSCFWDRMPQMGHFSCYMLVLITLLELIHQKNNGEKYHNNLRLIFCNHFLVYALFVFLFSSDVNLGIFRSKGILPSLTWHIKVLPVVIQKGMPGLSGFSSRMVI